MMEQLQVLGYFYDRNTDNETSDNLKYIIAIVNNNDKRKWIEGYNIMDGHFEIKDELWLSSCLKITKDEYLKGTKGFYTPVEYL